jgi:hypothetical protein
LQQLISANWGDIVMFWLLVTIAVTGLVIGTFSRVVMVAIASAVAIPVTAMASALAGHSVPTTIAITVGATMALQASYLIGLFLGPWLKRLRMKPQGRRKAIPDPAR